MGDRLKSNSDLSKEVRTFHEHFIGTLNKYRVPKGEWSENTKFKELSWPKMIKVIAKRGAKYHRQFMIQKTNSEQMHFELTQIMKKNKDIAKSDMYVLFKRYVEHIFIVINLIDENVYNKKP